MPGLGTSFGRGGATTAQQDLANADCILIEGSSMAEAHPVGFRWVMKAKEQGATIIHVDPRFSRTSALADIWVPIRAGSDIVFLGGLINHLIEYELFFREYVVHYTNASCILSDEYRDPEDNGDGYFSGWNEEKRAYEGNSWLYKGGDLSRPQRDLTLQDPHCVFQKLKRHFSRYTPEMVEKVCGISPDVFHKVAHALAAASGPERTAAVCYAVGWTQHSKGVQIIRAAAILQLLLGNIGRPGGGILALRGHASIQGSTDIPTLYDILPGYLTMPRKGDDDASAVPRQIYKEDRSLGTLPGIYGKHAQGLLRQACDCGQRFLLRVASQTYGQPFLLRISLRHARRKDGGHVFDGTKPSRRRAQLAIAAKGARETQMVSRAGHGRNRISKFLARVS